MKGINKFFYRLDLVKKLFFLICFVVAFACWFFPVGWIALLTLGPLSHLGLIFCFRPVRMPSDEEITKTIQENHKNYQIQVAKEHNIGEETVLLLDGFSDEKAHLARKMGSRVVYPVCRTLLAIKKDDTLSLFIKDTPLVEGFAAQQREIMVTAEERIALSVEEKRNGMFLMTLTLRGETMLLYIKDRYKVKEMIEKCSKYITCSKETMVKL